MNGDWEFGIAPSHLDIELFAIFKINSTYYSFLVDLKDISLDLGINKVFIKFK